MANTYLSRTPASSGTLTTWTYSCWVKRLKTDDDAYLIWSNDSGTTENDSISINSNNVIYYNIKNSNSLVGRLVTNQVFRDTSAWYHLVFVWDTTNATSGDRMRIYVNGERVTSFSTETQPSQDATSSSLNANKLHLINETNYGGSYQNVQTDILMAHVHFIDGTAYDASTFGETDATTGEWKIKTSPSVTYGTNGFFILKDGNSVTDQSGNGNNFTVAGGTLTNTEDCPSNVFATINPLDNYYNGQQSGSISNGNTKIQTGGSGIESYTTSTLGASSGKFYCEMKLISSTTTFKTRFGIAYEPTNSTTDWLGKRAVGWSYREDGRVTNNSSNYSGTWDSYTYGDIIGMAMDLDNNKLYFSKNGTWQNSGDPTSGATGTGGVTLTADKTYLIAIGDETGGYSVCELNFGNGYFGTTAVSSAGTNASGNGIFEYDVPTGYTALSTKGLNL